MKKDKFILSQEEKKIIKYLIIKEKGTPPECRTELWSVCSGAKLKLEEYKDYYKKCLKLSQKMPSLFESTIEKDIPRTSSEFLNNNPQYNQILKNILVCFSIRNSSIGYCQGFNTIVARILEITLSEVILYNFIL